MSSTSRHSRSLVEVIQKYLQAWQTFWRFYNFKKNIHDLQALQKFHRSHTKKSTSMSDILELLQLQKNIQDFQAHQESCRRHAKIFTSFTDFLKILQLQLQCSGPPGTSGVLWKSYKKNLQAWLTFWSLCNFRKMSRTSRHYESIVKVIKEYLQACRRS